MAADTSRQIKLTLHYDGSDFHGWQLQPGVRTVQGEVEGALSRLANGPITTVAAGRTDAGVHAAGQVVSVELPAKWTAPSIRKSLNAILPADVWVAAAESVASGFHARYSAVARGYIYRVGTQESAASPFRRGWCWPVRGELDGAVLARCAAGLVGRHSFRRYARTGQPERGYDCTVRQACWVDWPAGGLEFRIVANRFLHHMVRYLVGTMVDAARGRRPSADVVALLDETTTDGLETSPPAPSGGLFLVRVYYHEDDLTPEGPDNEDLP